MLASGNATCTPPGRSLNTVFVDLDDLADTTTYTRVTASVVQDGGEGDDTLIGSDAVDAFTSMDGGAGADTFIGGAGNDVVDYTGATAVTVTPDNVANDGAAGEGDNVGAAIHGVDGSDGDDTIIGGAVDSSIDGGLGNDAIAGGAGDDFISPGAGDDVVDGRAGDDNVSNSSGADDIRGGEGLDRVDLFSSGPAPAFASLPLSVTLDDVANDGSAGEGKNINSDVEDVTTSGGADTIVGNAAAQLIFSGEGNDAVDAGAGNDLVDTGGGDDQVSARDGFADRVSCGAGTDVAIVDTLDTVSSSCESQSRADVGNANEDKAPTVAITSPAANAKVKGGPLTVTVTASDDRGVARVVLFAGSRQVGADAVAPYSITYQPTGADVGRNTLIALAVDGDGQTATAVRDITLGRFTPRAVSLKITPARDRAVPYVFAARGAVSRPAGVSAAQGCRTGTGTVRVSVTRSGRTVARRTLKISRSCTYAARIRVGGRGRLTFRARFSGNAALSSRTSSGRASRAG